MSEPINIPLLSLGGITWSPIRRREPITIGIPFPPNVVRDPADLAVDGPQGRLPSQVRPLDRWPDGSIRWALVDTAIDAGAGRPMDCVIRVASGAPAVGQTGLRVTPDSGGVTILTGRARFALRIGGSFPVSSVEVGEGATVRTAATGFQIEHDGERLQGTISSVSVREDGPLRAELDVRGTIGDRLPLDLSARVEIFAGTSTLRLEVTVRNRRRARHPSGQWPLGDEGSVLLRSSRLLVSLGDPIRAVRCAPESGSTCSPARLPFAIHQESSGGDRWNGPVHRNRDGVVPMRFRGYRIQSGREESLAHRASPIVVAETNAGEVAVAVPRFWENFPQAIGVTDTTIDVGLFPETADLHELQGGEQKTHTVVVAFEKDAVADPPLAWVHEPLMIYPSPEWCCRAEAAPFLIPASADPNTAYLDQVNVALDPARGFVAKRELADEYGWRNFGDLYADHESAFQPADRPFVSHYNNQYDAIAGFAVHFFRTGDPRWWRLMDDLARHVRDIDVYHTRADKAAYNGGLFWHTNHYVDAGTSTHRTYPRGGGASGGPSAEHNYNAGLMFHYFMTGDRASRDAAVGLADWVVTMDDGRLTPFRWLAGGATGLASASGSMTYHGPGRGAANSVVACLVAFRLTGSAAYLAKAEELIARCVHPNQDLDALNLLDVERRWFYTVFLQALGAYLHVKIERREFDDRFGHARSSLLHYARWMAAHERPYLSRPEILEHRTETWAAQDMRKAEVFQWAAIHAGEDMRPAFLARADSYFRYAVETLAAMPGRHFTRPVVLMLGNGVRTAWFAANHAALPPPVASDEPRLPMGPGFEPQKVRAVRRAKWAAGVALAAIVGFAMFAGSC
jgi:hypothetical protein